MGKRRTMVSKNNQWQHLRASAQRVPHYGLRKLSVGVASVLLSTTLYMGVSAHADTIAGANPQPTTDQPASTVTGTSIGDATAAVQPKSTTDQSANTAANSSTSETDANTKSVSADTSKQPANVVDTQPVSTVSGTQSTPAVSGTQQTVTTNNTAPASDANTDSAPAPAMLPKQPVNTADTQSAEAANQMSPFMNLAVTSTNEDLTPKYETVGSQWRIHYVDSTNREQELKGPTVITMQYARTNTTQSDGKTQYGDWSYVPGSFKQTGTPITVDNSGNPVKQDNVNNNGKNEDVFTITVYHPAIAGYTPHDNITREHLEDHLLNYAASGKIQAPTMGQDFDVEYDPIDKCSVAVKFVDDQSYDFNTSDHKKQVGQAITLTGHDGDTVNLNLTVPDKYQLADGQQLPTTYTFTKGSGDLTIHLVHKVVQREATVNVKLAMLTEVDIQGVDWMRTTTTQERWGQLGGEFNNSGPEAFFTMLPSVEVGTLTGHVNYDVVDSKVVSFGDDWTTLNLGGHTYQLPNGIDVVNGVLIDSDDGSLGKPLKEFYLKHYSIVNPGHSVDPDYATRPWYGYLSVNETNDSNSPASDWNDLGLQGGLAGNEPNALAKANGDQAATAVETTNKTIDVSALTTELFSEQDGQLQATLPVSVYGVYIPYVEKTATRTINITTPDGKTTAVKQTVTLAKQVDLRKKVHPDWTTGEWISYDVPTIPGYTASQSSVAKDTVTGETKDQTVNITYTANPQTTTVVYQTEDGTSVHTTTVNGKTGQAVKVQNEVPAGWRVVNGNVPSEITFGPDGAPKTVVTIDHIHVTVTPDAPKTTGDKLPDNPSKAYPAGVGETDLNKTITRTIKVTTPDGQTKTIAQTAKLTRTADVDEVTGDVEYSNWTIGEWASYDVPTIPGYTASQSNVAKETVTGATDDQTINITYTANQQNTQIVFVDKDGKTVDTVDVNGKTGETVETNAKVPDKWKLVDNETVPSTITFSADTPDKITVHVEHKIETKQLKVDTNVFLPRLIKAGYGDLFDNQGYTLWINDDEFNSKEYWFGKPVDVGSVTGSVQYDLVSGKIVKVNNGETLKLGKTLLHYPSDDDVANGGYLSDAAVYDGVKKTFTDELNEITHENLNYKVYASANLTKDLLADKDGVISHYFVQDNEILPFTFKNGKQYGSDYEIDISTIDNSFSISFNDLIKNIKAFDINENDDGSLSTNARLFTPIAYQPYISKTVTRTINITNPDGTVKTIKQTAEINQNVGDDYDYDWEVHHGDYLRKGETYVTDNNWSAYEVPTINGYTASQNIVNAVSVDGNTTDQTINISYTANKQSVNVNYVDVSDGNKVVHTTIVDGVTGGEATVPNELPAGYKLVDGQSVPKTVHFNANNDDINIKVQHATVTVTSDSPKTSSDKLPDNPNKSYPSGVSENDLNKTVTRTIKVTQPDGTVTNKVQTVKLTRTAMVDEVTGEVTYGKWSTGQWDAYEVPVLKGYTASQTNVEATPVSENMKNQMVEISYTPNKQSTTIKYVGDKGQVMHTTTVDGVTDQTVKVPNEVPAGWFIVTGKVPSEITFGPDGYEPVVITIDHNIITLFPDTPRTPADVLPDNPSKHYPAGVGESDLNKPVTRTIKITQPNGTVTSKVQTVKLIRSAKVDEVTGEVHEYSDWFVDGKSSWDAYEIPTVPGYTASQANVAATPVDENTKDQTVEVNYTPNKQSTAIKYVDDKGDVVYTTTVDGVTDQTVKVPNEVPAGWMITKGKVPSELIFDADGHESIEVVVAHRHVTVDSNHPQTNGTKLPDNPAKAFEGVEANDLNKTITRTIEVTTPDGQTKTAAQTVKLARNADVDEVTGEVTYGKWSTGQWDSYEIPALKGYTASQTNVEATPVDENTKDQTVDINYTANSQTTHINYVDDSGKTVHTTIVTGRTGETVKVPNEVPAGWKITEGEVPSEISFGPNGYTDETITIGHQHVTVDPGHPQTNGTKLPDNPAKVFNGVEVNDLNKTITRTIEVTTPDGKLTTTKQTVKLTRTADVDEVTGEVTYGNWTTGQWSAYEVPALNGYTASQASVAATPVDENTKDQTVEINYTPNKQSTTIKYVDDKGGVVHTTTVTGVTDQKVKVPNEVSAGWMITKGEVPSEITFGVDGHEPIEVMVDHRHITVTPDHPQNNGTKLPDDPAKTFNGVEVNDLNKTITRTIKVTTPDGKSTTTKQTAKLTRTADVDEVTGEVTYGKWTTGEWTAYNVPSVTGYTPSQTAVAKESVTATSNDTTVEVTYQPMQHQIRVEYVDDDDHGKVVKTDQVPGKTDQTITVTPSAPANYDLVDNGSRTYTVTSDDAQAVQIHVKHHQVTTSESKTVTRTVNVHTPHDGAKVVKQTAELTRDVTTDQITGNKAYGDWTTGQWKSYTPEAIPGYTPSTNEVLKTNVDGNSKNQTVDVTYTADAQKVEIAYVDDTKGDEVVKTDQIAGKTDETVKVTPDVPTGYELVGKVPGDYTMTADGHQTITVHLVHQMKTSSESKTVTRTINVHTPHDGTKVVKQTAKLTRNVTTDQVTGEKTYGDWSTTEWDRYAVPAVAGYSPSIEQVAQQVVNGTTTDQTIDVIYSSGKHITHINYVDGDGNIVHTTTIKGQTDGTSQVPNETPAGWMVIGEPVPTELAFGPDGHVDVTVTVAHQHVTVTSDEPRENGTKLPDNPAKTFNGVEANDLNKTITRTIKVTTLDGQTKTVAQTAKLTRTADVDEVTGEVTYGKWSAGQWDSYQVPVLKGYTASQTEVAATSVNENTKDQTVEVSYTPNKQSTTIKYVDDNGDVVHTTTVDGVTDQTVKVPSEVPAGWTITKGEVPSEITFGVDGHESVVITVSHRHVTVDSSNPKPSTDTLPDNPTQHYPSGVSESYLNKTITRTVKITQPDGTVTNKVQTAKLTRNADVDEVTGEVTYGKWSAGQWDAYEIPALKGYTASQTNVEATPVDENTKDQTVEINYTPNKQSTTIKYVDDKGDVVHTTTVTGVTDQTVKVPNEVPTGWTITGGQVPSKLTFGADDHEPVVITISHRHVTVTSDQPRENGTKLPDNPAKTFEGVEANDLNKIITRTIKVTTPDGQTNTVAQTVKLTRTADVDEVTGEVKYGAWTTGQWDAYEIPVLKGYTASQTNVEATSVDENTKNQTVEINYTPNKQSTTIKYVDNKGDVVHTTTVNGVTDQTVKVSSEVPAGWMITKGEVPSEITFGADGHEPVMITVSHRHVNVTPDQPRENGTKLPDNLVKTFNGVEANDLNKTITRTIKVTTPDGKSTTTKQEAKLTRTADVDEVTGEVKYGAWTTGQWDSYEIPALKGYTASQTNVEATPVDENAKDQTVEVSYTPNKQSTTIKYVDDKGQVVHTTTVTGKTDQTVKVPNEVPTGWTITGGQVPSKLTFGADGHEPIEVTVDHRHVTVTPDQPQDNGTKLPDNPAKTFNGVEANDLNKTITRTIKVTTPDGKSTTTKQEAKLTRTADVDEVTGDVTYSNWTTGQWDAYQVPALKGYTASQTSVEATPVSETTTDQTVEIDYAPNKQSTTIKYVDTKGEVVHMTTVDGVTDQTVKVPSEVPAGWMITDGQVPSEITFDADGHEPVVITISHRHVTVTSDQPRENGTKLPDNPAKTFNGVGENDLNKMVTRTINITTPSGKTDTITQTAKLTRTADVDEVTGKVTYGPWSTGKWNAYQVPVLKGYTASQAEVPAAIVGSTTDNQTVTVDYQAVEVPTTSTTTPEARLTATLPTSGAKLMTTPTTQPTAPATKAAQLPQTGADKVASGIMSSLGLLMATFSAYALSRKRKNKGHKA